jgi:hypothetical protein
MAAAHLDVATLTFAPRVQLADGRTVDITERPTRLGRGDFSGPHVSREQCQLQLVGGCVKLKSLGMNATLVFPPKDPGVTEHSGALAERDGIRCERGCSLALDDGAQIGVTSASSMPAFSARSKVPKREAPTELGAASFTREVGQGYVGQGQVGQGQVGRVRVQSNVPPPHAYIVKRTVSRCSSAHQSESPPAQPRE